METKGRVDRGCEWGMGEIGWLRLARLSSSPPPPPSYRPTNTPSIMIERIFNSPVSQIWALTVLPSTLIDLVANSTPIVDLDSRLNSFLVNRESTRASVTDKALYAMDRHTVSVRRQLLYPLQAQNLAWGKEETHDLPTPESPINTTYTNQLHTPPTQSPVDRSPWRGNRSCCFLPSCLSTIE
jgi:hypothetical protein